MLPNKPWNTGACKAKQNSFPLLLLLLGFGPGPQLGVGPCASLNPKPETLNQG